MRTRVYCRKPVAANFFAAHHPPPHTPLFFFSNRWPLFATGSARSRCRRHAPLLLLGRARMRILCSVARRQSSVLNVPPARSIRPHLPSVCALVKGGNVAVAVWRAPYRFRRRLLECWRLFGGLCRAPISCALIPPVFASFSQAYPSSRVCSPWHIHRFDSLTSNGTAWVRAPGVLSHPLTRARGNFYLAVFDGQRRGATTAGSATAYTTRWPWPRATAHRLSNLLQPLPRRLAAYHQPPRRRCRRRRARLPHLHNPESCRLAATRWSG